MIVPHANPFPPNTPVFFFISKPTTTAQENYRLKKEFFRPCGLTSYKPVLVITSQLIRNKEKKKRDV